ncbi:MAG: hypothetical protein E7280_10030 [Lachnospiraceae bacterium]|jgi:environmental stress-induced protein Ves|nr:hypothetical protein [Lachnospiraceae bacterium]
MINVIRQSEYKKSTWNGGETWEILIAPEKADYAKRDFRFRVSTATCLLPESDFTSLPGVDRYLTTLDGTLELIFEKEESVFVNPDVVVNFSGDKNVHCIGTCRDFNLMLKGSTGKMYRIRQGDVLEINAMQEYVVFAVEAGILHFADDRYEKLAEGDSCHIKGTNIGCRWENARGEAIVVEIKRQWGR